MCVRDVCLSILTWKRDLSKARTFQNLTNKSIASVSHSTRTTDRFLHDAYVLGISIKWLNRMFVYEYVAKECIEFLVEKLVALAKIYNWFNRHSPLVVIIFHTWCSAVRLSGKQKYTNNTTTEQNHLATLHGAWWITKFARFVFYLYICIRQIVKSINYHYTIAYCIQIRIYIYFFVLFLS